MFKVTLDDDSYCLRAVTIEEALKFGDTNYRPPVSTLYIDFQEDLTLDDLTEGEINEILNKLAAADYFAIFDVRAHVLTDMINLSKIIDVQPIAYRAHMKKKADEALMTQRHEDSIKSKVVPLNKAVVDNSKEEKVDVLTAATKDLMDACIEFQNEILQYAETVLELTDSSYVSDNISDDVKSAIDKLNQLMLGNGEYSKMDDLITEASMWTAAAIYKK